ncbi:MAG: DJ-1/PfpI family protein [Tannerella sp.]|jgi:4-methyl-5(b-hydroxyethyl)-thiazole monophosphate biosynthesis|nr:DJ-1/PfpI family protein [Tannerella sp.]
MKKAYLFLATGFEETEAVGTIDVLRRGGIDVVTVSITGETLVEGAHRITIEADTVLFEAAPFADADALILPGGGPGSRMLDSNATLKNLLDDYYSQGKLVAAICAAPLVFGGMGLLKGKRATCYPGIEPELTGAVITGEAATTDGNIITGKGPGLVFDFALAVLEYLCGKETALSVASDLLLN